MQLILIEGAVRKYKDLVGPLATLLVRIASMVSIIGFYVQQVDAKTSYSEECYHAARVAAHETDVPYEVLIAIAHVETGRQIDGQIRAWPWAINHVGHGEWLSNKSELLDAALAYIARGQVSFDVGCFQLNYRWHGAEFASLDEMISPKENARYAARFLQTLYREYGDWTEAAGAYHSRTKEHATAYKAKFLVHYDDDSAPRQSAGYPTMSVKKRTNSYPLLVSRTMPSTLGSLVPGDMK